MSNLKGILKVLALAVTFLGALPAWVALWASVLVAVDAGPGLWTLLVLYFALNGLAAVLSGVSEAVDE